MLKYFKKNNYIFSLLLLLSLSLSFYLIVFYNFSKAANYIDECLIEATDQEKNMFSFYLAGSPGGMFIDPFTGVISGAINEAGFFPVHVFASDEYGAVSNEYSYGITVNTYCGDGEIQAEGNGEGRGGPSDNGREECDGLTGIAHNSFESNSNRMYSCSDTCEIEAENCLNTCEFLDYRSGGGYCGDGVVQDGSTSVLWEDGSWIEYPQTNFGEECERGEDKLSYYRRTSGNLTATQADADAEYTDIEFTSLSLSCSLSDCQIRCESAQDIIGTGCYIDSGCQKGRYTCNDLGAIICTDVFSVPVYDSCCENPGDVSDLTQYVADGDLLIIRGSGSSFYCDNVCRSYNAICVGVGLTTFPTEGACRAVIHDEGNDCSKLTNTSVNDCRATYRAGATRCTDDAGGPFNTQESRCYCYSPS